MTDLVEPKQVDIVYETEEPVRYEVIDSVAWITMNRPQFNNAQNGQMTYALDDAFNRAVQDDNVRAIVLAGEGKHFSAGHDIGTPGRDLHHEFDKRLMFPPHTNKPGAELLYTREQEQYLGMCRRADAGLGVRPHRRFGRCVLPGPGQSADGHSRRGILRPCL